MSWSISTTGTQNEVRKAVAESFVPGTIKGYIFEAADKFGADDFLYVYGSGHLYEGSGSYEVTSASLTVRPLTDDEKKAAGYMLKWVK